MPKLADALTRELDIDVIKWLKTGLSLALFVASLVIIYEPALLGMATPIAEADVFNEDVRQQIWPFFRYQDSSLFQDDLIADYYMSCFPVGYRLLYIGSARLADPVALSKLLPVFLMAGFLTAMAMAAARFGAMPAAWCAVAICLSTPTFFLSAAGGLPRAFAFPLLALVALALVRGRVVLLCGIVVIAAAFYPVATAIGGFALALTLLVLPARDRGTAAHWSLRRRLGVLSATALMAAIIVLPVAISSHRFGPVLTPADATEFPESGPGGRFGPGDRAPFGSPWNAIRHQSRATFLGAGPAWIESIGAPAREGGTGDGGRERAATRTRILMWTIHIIMLIGMVRLAMRDAGARRLLTLFAAGVIGYGISALVAPRLYIPHRYITYPIPILAAIALPAAAGELPSLFRRLRERPRVRATSMLAICIFTLVLAGGRGNALAGYMRWDSENSLYKFVASIPPDSLIAGWPEGPVDNFPYVCRRSVLISRETHQGFHTVYVLAMRERMSALIDAYFAGNIEPLIRLRDEFGVTHLFVDLGHLRSSPPVYFKPFNERTQNRFDEGQVGGFEITRQLKRATVYRDLPLVILDLSRLRAGAGRPD